MFHPKQHQKMKEEDDFIILNAIYAVLNDNDWTFYAPLDKSTVATMLLQAYSVADRDGVTSMHLRYIGITYILSERRCSCILNDKSTFWQSTLPIVLYKDIEDDVYHLCEAMQFAYLCLDE